MEFTKNEKDKPHVVPEEIKRLNIKYELSKIGQADSYCEQMPILDSIKNFFITDEVLLFSIDLNLRMEQEDLQIKILTLNILFFSGKRIEISINESFEMSEICVNEEEIASIRNMYQYPEKKPVKTSLTQERVYKEVTRDLQKNEEKGTLIYEKRRLESTAAPKTHLVMSGESDERLKNMELYLKEISETLKHMSFNGGSSGGVYYSSSQDQGIRRIKRVPSKSIGTGPPRRAAFLGELKEVFGNVMKDTEFLNLRDVLKPMSEEELREIMLDEEELKKKELEAFTRVVKKLEEKESKHLLLEDLKKPG